MRYLIDGHNLIPHIPGLSLEMLDDEQQLVIRLQVFCQVGRHQVEVFFDGSPPGHAGRRRYGMVTAVFVSQGRIADDAIRRRLRQLGAEARQWTVVSSDQAVQVAAREVHAGVMRSEEFAQRMGQAGPAEDEGEKPGDAPLSSAEVDEWLKTFRSERRK